MNSTTKKEVYSLVELTSKIKATDKHSKVMYNFVNGIYWVAIGIYAIIIVLNISHGYYDRLQFNSGILILIIIGFYSHKNRQTIYSNVDYSLPVTEVLKLAIKRYDLTKLYLYFPKDKIISFSLMYFVSIGVGILLALPYHRHSHRMFNLGFWEFQITFHSFTLIISITFMIYLWKTKYKSIVTNSKKILEELES